jgi:hypothetical protein
MKTLSSLVLRVVLLFAVAYSQILGGISCCCLSRMIVAGVTASSDVAPSAETDLSAVSKLPAPKCPKCASSQTAAARSVSATGVQAYGVAGGSECQCAKRYFVAIVQLEPRSPAASAPFLTMPLAIWCRDYIEVRSCHHRAEVPIRFGGHSWQSIACIWKN